MTASHNLNIKAIWLDSVTMLLPISPENASTLYTLVDTNRASLLPWMEFARYYTMAYSEGFVARAVVEATEGVGFYFTVRRVGDIIGVVSVHGIDQRNRMGQIGYWLTASERGQGIATRALRRLVWWAIEEIGLNRIELRIHPKNARSQAMAMRLGCVHEGCLIEAEWTPDGFRNVDVFATTATRWRQLTCPNQSARSSATPDDARSVRANPRFDAGDADVL